LQGVTSQNIGDFFPIPRYDDYQAILSLKPQKDEDIDIIFLASDDHLRRTIPSSDPAEVRSENDDSSFYRGFIRYTRLMPDGASLTITPSVGYDTSHSVTRFGATPTDNESYAWKYGLRSSYRKRPRKWVTLSLGLDMQGTVTHSKRSGSLDIPPREGDIFVFGRPPGDDINADDWTNHIVDVAPYLFAELTFGKFTIIPGLRLDAVVIEGSSIAPAVVGVTPIGFSRLDWGVDPRLSVVYRPSKRLTFTAAVGLYHQAPDPGDLSPVFGNPLLNLSTALHVSFGTAFKITGTLSCELVGFFKRLSDLPSRNEAGTPPLAQAIVQEGLGRSYGGQILLRQELFKGFFGWVTYSLSRSERRDHMDRDWRLFDYDQTHVLGVVASYEYHGWVAGVRFRYTSGMPRTPVIGSFYDVRDDQYQPIFGRQNSIRIPDFVQLDVRLEKTFTFRRVQLNVFADIQNVTNRANPEEIAYNYNFTKRAYIIGLPVLSVVGLRFQW
jgi:hypothetical protein